MTVVETEKFAPKVEERTPDEALVIAVIKDTDEKHKALKEPHTVVDLRREAFGDVDVTFLVQFYECAMQAGAEYLADGMEEEGVFLALQLEAVCLGRRLEKASAE